MDSFKNIYTTSSFSISSICSMNSVPNSHRRHIYSVIMKIQQKNYEKNWMVFRQWQNLKHRALILYGTMELKKKEILPKNTSMLAWHHKMEEDERDEEEGDWI